jgi:hypothetical protein
MAWLAAIGTLLQIILFVIQQWFKWSDEKKAKVQLLLKEVPNAKTESDYTQLFDSINNL